MVGLERPFFFLQSLRYELDQVSERRLILLLVIAIDGGWLFASLLDQSKEGEGLGFDGLKICFVCEEGLRVHIIIFIIIDITLL